MYLAAHNVAFGDGETVKNNSDTVSALQFDYIICLLQGLSIAQIPSLAPITHHLLTCAKYPVRSAKAIEAIAERRSNFSCPVTTDCSDGAARSDLREII